MIILRQISNSQIPMLHWLHNVNVNTDCDCGDSQADPPFVFVAQGDFSGVNLRSCDCSFLNT